MFFFLFVSQLSLNDGPTSSLINAIKKANIAGFEITEPNDVVVKTLSM